MKHSSRNDIAAAVIDLSGVRVPREDRAAIARALRVNHLPVLDTEVRRLYLEKKRRDQGGGLHA